MIKYILSGVDINSLTNGSKEQVIRVCDVCTKEDILTYKDYNKARNNKLRKGIELLDACKSCSYRLYTHPNKGKSMNLEQRQKISMRMKERFSKDGSRDYLKNRLGNNNPNKKSGLKINSRRHLVKYELGKEIKVHREVYENFHDVVLNETDIIHHINKNPIDNRPENLVMLKSHSEHTRLHRQLESVAAELVDQGVIVFDRISNKYVINHSVITQFMPLSLGFDDVSLSQDKNVVKSRLDIDISTFITKNIKRPIPLIASNMSTVINEDFYIRLYNMGALGIMHRAWSNDDDYINTMKNISKSCDIVAASVGVGKTQHDLAKRLIMEADVNMICIDIAHGYSDAVVEIGNYIKKINRGVDIIVGNTTNPNIIYDVYKFADAIKVGIAQGLACETKNTAGCTEGQFSAILKFKHISKDTGIPIISDGGIREPSHFVKSIAAGASSVMAGSIFAACPESAASIISINDVDKKIYAGMASRYVQNEWKGGVKEGTCTEGKVVYIDIKGQLQDLLEHYTGALRSGITYGGADNIQTFHNTVRFVRLASSLVR